jgi:nicotinamidase-related amidase
MTDREARAAASVADGAAATLLDADDCLLAIVDVQTGFAGRLHPGVRDGLLERVALIATSARWLRVPTVVTVERPEAWGPTDPTVAGAVPAATALRKEVFGLGDDPAVLEAVAAAARGTVVLCGMETEVCVAQSALSLLERGFGVVCVADAVASPDDAGHRLGLQRMRDAGVVLLSAKQLHYEWMRTVSRARSFRGEHPEIDGRLL